MATHRYASFFQSFHCTMEMVEDTMDAVESTKREKWCWTTRTTMYNSYKLYERRVLTVEWHKRTLGVYFFILFQLGTSCMMVHRNPRYSASSASYEVWLPTHIKFICKRERIIIIHAAVHTVHSKSGERREKENGKERWREKEKKKQPDSKTMQRKRASETKETCPVQSTGTI